MTCPQCDKATLLKSDRVQHSGKYRGVDLSVTTPGLRCPNCGYTTMQGRDMGRFQNALREAYRQHQGLLARDEFKSIRQRMGVSQEAFSKLMGVGVASVKRWEAGGLPAKSSDAIIRQRSDPRVAEALVQEAYWVFCEAFGSLATLPKLEEAFSANWEDIRQRAQALLQVHETVADLNAVHVDHLTVAEYVRQSRAMYGPSQESDDCAAADNQYALCA
jgi:putative zinc finger/helix-turn-helix YgiT family protein